MISSKRFVLFETSGDDIDPEAVPHTWGVAIWAINSPVPSTEPRANTPRCLSLLLGCHEQRIGKCSALCVLLSSLIGVFYLSYANLLLLSLRFRFDGAFECASGRNLRLYELRL